MRSCLRETLATQGRCERSRGVSLPRKPCVRFDLRGRPVAVQGSTSTWTEPCHVGAFRSRMAI